MLLIVRTKINSESRQKVAEDLKGYIKVVVDVRRKILSAGGQKHVDGEKMLLRDGSRQDDLWGAGLDLETRGYPKIAKNLSFPNALVGNPDEDIIRPPTKTFGGDNFGIGSNQMDFDSMINLRPTQNASAPATI